MPMANLYIYPKSGEPSSVPLAGQRVTIGRASTNDIVLSDQFSSGCHAAVVPTERGYALVDQGSKNWLLIGLKFVLWWAMAIAGVVLLVRNQVTPARRKKLLLAAVLVSATILLFIRDWRTTVIATLAIPTSIIPTFLFMHYMGFTLNNITMLALILWMGLSVGWGGPMIWFTIGAIFCLAGDVFLMVPRDRCNLNVRGAPGPNTIKLQKRSSMVASG